MMQWLPYLLVVLLVGMSVLGWAMTLFGLPGNWLMLACAAGYAWLGPQQGVMQIGWATVGGIAALCLVAELAEMLTSVWGARRAGGSRRAAVFALVGSLVGAVGGAIVGVPIPLVGSAVGAVLGGGFGALAGAALAEQSRGESGAKSWQVGHAAFWGRLLGTGIKSIVATIIAVWLVVALFV